MHIRKYQLGDDHELWQLFFNTIRTINIQDYTREQVEAWAPDRIDGEAWRERMESIDPYVCVQDDIIVGYADLQLSGYIDHFYVHHERQRQGVGRCLFNKIEEEATSRRLSQLESNVSITARPFFESLGFNVVTAQHVTLGSVVLKNFKMMKSLR